MATKVVVEVKKIAKSGKWTVSRSDDDNVTLDFDSEDDALAAAKRMAESLHATVKAPGSSSTKKNTSSAKPKSKPKK